MDIEKILEEWDYNFTKLCYDAKDSNIEYIGFKGNCEQARDWLKEKLLQFREIKLPEEKELLENNTQDNVFENMHRDGWNECLEETKRLNNL